MAKAVGIDLGTTNSVIATVEGETAVSTAHAYLRWVGAIDIREDIKRIRCPTLVIGTDTKHRGREVFESWQKTIPGSELVMLPVDGGMLRTF